MKKLLLTMLGVVGMLCSTSCSDEEIVASVEGEAVAQFTVELSDGSDASRAISDGTTVDKVYYEVWGTQNGVYQLILGAGDVKFKGSESIVGKKATVNLSLVKSQTYDIVFWASKDGVYNTNDLTSIAVNEGLANDEEKDAFTAKRTYTVNGPIKETVILRRPFAQINFGTPADDIAAARAAGATISQSKIKVTNLAHYYNALTENGMVNEGAEPQTVEFGLKAIQEGETLTVGEKAYKYLATAYVLFPGDSTTQVTSDLTMTVPTGLNQDVVLTVPNAPAQRNFRTNVLGNLLTNTAEFNIVVDPIYNPEDNNIDVWDGSTTTTPEADVNGVYRITTAAELVAMMNDSYYPNCNKYQNVLLENDIDLGGYTVKGFGDDSGFFDGIFDGQGHTISNFKIDATNRTYYAGLFNQVSQYSGENTVIKNLTVRNATVSGTSQVGIIAGGANGNTVVENCKVFGCTVKAVKKVGSVIGYTAGGTVKNCHAEDCVIEFLEKEAGEVIGFVNIGSTVENNTFENITFRVSAVALAKEMTPDANGVINVTRDYVVVGDWTSLALSGEITIKGNGHTISNLNKPLLVGNNPNKLTVDGLTIANSEIGVATNENGLGTGAFISYIDAVGYATFNNCHLISSKVNGNERAGGLIAYCSGTNLNINNCTVVDCEIKAVGGAGGFAAYNQSETVVENSKVEGCTVEATEDRTGKQALAGSVIGTVNGPATINNVISTDNIVKNYGATGASEMFGRILSTINGSTYVTNLNELKSAINEASAGDVIVLGDGTFEGYLNIGKNVTLKAYNQGSAIFDGMIHVTNSDSEIKLEGLTLKNTNGVKTSATDLTAKVNGSIVGVYNAKKVEIVDCTFDITGDYGVMGYAVYGDVIIDGCVFNCNKNRPIATNGQYTKVTNCTFNNQYQYSLRLYEWAGEKQTVVFTDNTIAGETQKTPVDGINFSNRGNLGDYSIYGDFTITGNTAGLSFRYKNGMSMNAASIYNTDIEGFEFVSE